ncbi:MAG: hypothetical protein IPK34_08250 [Ramlibacter sp.]|nr:hypothetical protein [Ramlibacter sp.]
MHLSESLTDEEWVLRLDADPSDYPPRLLNDPASQRQEHRGGQLPPASGWRCIRPQHLRRHRQMVCHALVAPP